MPTAREVKKRIRSVKNIGQITRALQAVSASRVRKAQARVSGRVPAARFCRNRDFTNQLREDGTTLGVCCRLVVLDVLPFTVASHASRPRAKMDP